jgi:hypothetical protein
VGGPQISSANCKFANLRTKIISLICGKKKLGLQFKKIPKLQITNMQIAPFADL